MGFLKLIGGIISTFIMSRARMRRQLADVRFVLVSLIVIVGYWLLVAAFNALLRLELDLSAVFIATLPVALSAIFIYRLLSRRARLLSVLNRASAIMASNLEIQAVFDSFVMELRKMVDIGWAAIALIRDSSLYISAVSPETGSAWKVGQKVPVKDAAAEWVAAPGKAVVEFDLWRKSHFDPAEYSLSREIRSVASLPLMVQGRAIGSLILTSHQPGAYHWADMMLLERVASQIAMPVQNSWLYAEAVDKARIDELTGLLNRRSLDEMLASEINRNSRYGGVFSLIILDLDFFKAFNDSRGHLAGDSLLGEIGDVLRDSIRTADRAFRYGGDEFAVLLPHTSMDAAGQVAERIRKQIASKAMGDVTSVTASLGLASWPTDGREAAQLIAAADAALYQAKRSGGNQSRCAAKKE